MGFRRLPRLAVLVVCVLFTLFATMLASCTLFVGFDEYGTSPLDVLPDAGPAQPMFAVTGRVDGLEGARVTLVLDKSARVDVGDGPFAFPPVVQDGKEYVVEIVASPPGHVCSIERPTGRIAGADGTGVVVHCPSTDARLVDLSLSIGSLSPAFAPDVTAYSARTHGARIFTTAPRTTTITARAAHPRARLTITGALAESGKPSAAIPLSPGANPIDVSVTAIDGSTRRYVVVVSLEANVFVKASNTRAGARFGEAIAVFGDTLVVGAPYEASAAVGVGGDQTSTAAPGAGAVYVYGRTGSTWSQQAYLKASNARADAHFGSSVALRGDTLVVGSSGEFSLGNPNDTSAQAAGAVYVFTRTGTTWTEEAYLKASNPRSFAQFGCSVALDGDTIVVGSFLEDGAGRGVNAPQFFGAPDSGAAYVFTRTGNTWSQQAYLKASNARSDTAFGIQVAISGDTVAVGSVWERSSAVGIDGDEANISSQDAGAVYVFSRSAGVWTQDAYVKASNTRPNAWFGSSVALSGDTLVVGAPRESSGAKGVGGSESDTSAPIAGAVYVFARSGGIWSQTTYVKASNTAANDTFGFALSIAGDTFAVGALGESSNATGVDGTQTKHAAFNNSGAVYVFTKTGSSWAQRAFVKASNTRPDVRFGIAVALTTETLAIGTYREPSSATGIGGNQSDATAPLAGAVYVFRD